MPNAVTCVSCTSSLPAYEASVCNPQTQSGGIQRLFLTLLGDGADFNPPAVSPTPPAAGDVDFPGSWSARQDNTAAATNFIITAHVKASKDRPEDTKAELSLKRTKVTGRKHTVKFSVDEVNKKSHDFWRKVSQCGLQCGMWYETSGKLLFGSTEGVEIPIKVSIAAGMVIPVENDGIITWEGEAEWDVLGTENFIPSVVPDAEEPA